MNLVDILVIVILGLYVLLALYRGFYPTLLGLGANVVSWLGAMIFMPLMSNSIKANASMFNMLLYYTEGAEYIGDVELARRTIDTISSQELTAILESSNLPFPFAKEISENVARRAFESMGISTLGDYFNQTMVCVVINIIVFLILFAIIRVILSVIINGLDYSVKLPQLKQYDKPITLGFGFLRGVVALLVIFMAMPLLLIIANFDFVHQIIDSSFFAPFFYHGNIFLAMMSGV